jgi:hypothetical protein
MESPTVTSAQTIPVMAPRAAAGSMRPVRRAWRALRPHPGGRDNVTATHLSIIAPSFDSLRLYARLNGDYMTMRAVVDNVSMVPTPASLLPLSFLGLAFRHRRWRL